MAQNPPEENSWMFAHVCTKSSVPEQLLQDDHFGIDRENVKNNSSFLFWDSLVLSRQVSS